MGVINIDLMCTDCEAHSVTSVSWHPDLWDQRWSCPCGSLTGIKRIPNLSAVMRKALPDGNGRFSNLKKAAKIESAAMDLPRDQRGEMLAEAHKLKSLQNNK